MLSKGIEKIELKCRRFQGKIITKGYGVSLKYLDQIYTNTGYWVSRSYIKRYLRLYYGISEQEYYNLIVYGDINYYPKCKYCGNQLKFWRLINGYYSTCAKSECISKSHSESNYNRWMNMSEEERSEFCNKIGIYLKSNEGSRNTAWWKIYWMDIPESTICELYIALTADNKFKFGFSTNSINRKIKMNYKKVKVIVRAPKMQIADLEYYIKEYLDLKTEYLEFNLNNILKFCEAYSKLYYKYITSSTTIEKTL